jgi:hypothetical protein
MASWIGNLIPGLGDKNDKNRQDRGENEDEGRHVQGIQDTKIQELQLLLEVRT